MVNTDLHVPLISNALSGQRLADVIYIAHSHRRGKRLSSRSAHSLPNLERTKTTCNPLRQSIETSLQCILQLCLHIAPVENQSMKVLIPRTSCTCCYARRTENIVEAGCSLTSDGHRRHVTHVKNCRHLKIGRFVSRMRLEQPSRVHVVLRLQLLRGGG